MSRLLIRRGRVIDPSQSFDRRTDLLLVDGRVAAYDAVDAEAEVIDADGCLVVPGLIDMAVELREPGCEEDETIETGTAAAIAGGFTSIACLPSTDPPLDTQAGVEFVRQKAQRARNCNVFVLGCVSKNREGQQLAELGSLAGAEAVGFTDAPRSIGNTELMRRALEYCLMFDKPILEQPEVPELTHGGIMHEGRTSMVLGLTGMPVDAEEVAVSRDLRLAESTHGRLHLLGISTAGSVELIRRAKARGLKVTASVSIANLVFTDERLRTFDSNYMVKPPLRSPEHVEACLAGLVDGTLDAITSGHSPRASEKKMRELDQAPFGITSLETTLALVMTHLIRPGIMEWGAALSKLTSGPARILGLSKGSLRIGADADVTIFNPETRWTVDPTKFRSKSTNTPLAGVELQGRPTHVIVGGERRGVTL